MNQEVDAIIARLTDWRGPVLARMRDLVLSTEPGIVEEIKWRKPSNPAGVPVWSNDGIICTGELYRAKVKLTFANGAKLPDPAGLLNGSTGGTKMRAIDLHEGEMVDADAFQALVRAAIAFNRQR
ncbi:DUF1801 domain-containing protein [Sphingomonas sp. BN140010]|uniref:DUF1801 domain-containing protein n=1 Tax=Sphingomonas arvum TaxID=2992113 RepID=A0ABT3JFG8_9SPHN|nr:DUF1801 domain-containing protein [Sphingomonas sp. BN140010]MCW3797803.1 DUF1801 domain-containing protein [Sphingomonas sp. BN140010]